MFCSETLQWKFHKNSVWKENFNVLFRNPSSINQSCLKEQKRVLIVTELKQLKKIYKMWLVSSVTSNYNFYILQIGIPVEYNKKIEHSKVSFYKKLCISSGFSTNLKNGMNYMASVSKCWEGRKQRLFKMSSVSVFMARKG